MVPERDPYRTASASIAALGHALIEVEPVSMISNGQDVPQAQLNVMQELYFLLMQLAKALVQKQ